MRIVNSFAEMVCRLDCFEMATYNECSDEVKKGGMLTTKRQGCIISEVDIMRHIQDDSSVLMRFVIYCTIHKTQMLGIFFVIAAITQQI